MDKIGVEYKSVFSDLFEGTRLLETGEKGGGSTINSLYLVIKGIETLYSSTTPGILLLHLSMGLSLTSAQSSSLLLLCVLTILASHPPPTASSPHPLPPSGDSGPIKFCSNRLLEGIQSYCRNPRSFQYIMAFGVSKRKRSQDLAPDIPSPIYDPDEDEDDPGLEEEDEEEEEEEVIVERTAASGDSSLFNRINLEIRRKNIVDACCRNGCSEAVFKQYCAMARLGERMAITTPTTTTTTTTTPAPVVVTGVGSLQKSLRSEAQIRKDLIQSAIWCLYHPSCSGAGKRQKARPRILSQFCGRGSKKHGLTKEQEQSQLLAVLVRMLSWGIPKQKPVPEEDHSDNSIPRLPSASRFTIGGQNAGKFGVPSFGRQNVRESYVKPHPRPGYGHAQMGGGGGQFEVRKRPATPVVTDASVQTKLGFGLGTNDGVLFNN